MHCRRLATITGDCLDFSALSGLLRVAWPSRQARRKRNETERVRGGGGGGTDRISEHDGRDSFHINNGGSSITSGGGNGRYAETEKGAR